MFVYLLRAVAGLVVSGTLMAGGIGVAVHGGDPLVQAQQMQAQMAIIMPRMMVAAMALGLATMVLLAAALVRRLHDAGLSGWFVLLPGVPYVLALVAVPAQTARLTVAMQAMRAAQQVGGHAMEARPHHGMMGAVNWSAVGLGWLALILLVALATRAATPGTNRFGPEPG
ncbi:hypothetical protein NUTIK01_02310 [Novosphingobium sp. IK01]|uniref:DUF1772 domain-containing protein n=1 Tax=Novosphingobium pituita TaxID=3056842 RepID=A0ABQ6P2I0_9SPHN|nr:hypothetical protein NUTIK01_02310 [Novosphingobium sp. IK01]